MTKRSYQLDGLRAIAVGGVLVQHGLGLVGGQTNDGGFALGSVGVRLFFVLSGFLITGILLDARQDAREAGGSRWSIWRAFYCRRALRILPLGYAVLLVASVIGAPSVLAHPWMYATYTSNYFVAIEGFRDPSVDHYWSLAIEEQFYLFWPVVVLAIPERWLSMSMLLVVAASMVARAVILATMGVHPSYVLTPSRLDALAVGGLVALLVKRSQVSEWRLGWICVGIGVVARVLARWWPDTWLTMPLPETGYVFVSGAIVLWVSSGIGGLVGRFLQSRPLVYIGTISYGIYVYHMAIAELLPMALRRWGLPSLFPDELGWPRFVWMIVTTIPVAALSWRYFERPLNDVKSRFPYVRRPTAALAIASRATIEESRGTRPSPQ